MLKYLSLHPPGSYGDNPPAFVPVCVKESVPGPMSGGRSAGYAYIRQFSESKVEGNSPKIKYR